VVTPLQRYSMVLDSRKARAMGLGTPPPSANAPVVNPNRENFLAPGEPGRQLSRGWCNAERVVLAGGALTSQIVHPSITQFEQLFRVLPEEGMFDPRVTPQRPFSFEMGAFRAPGRMALALFDLRPDIYRFSGIDAGDYVPVEARRFASIMGFDILIDGRRTDGNIQYQLDPQAIQHGGTQAYQPEPGSTDLYAALDIGQSSSFASPAGSGNALTPQRPTRYGALSLPFMMLVRSGQVVQIRCVIFRRIPSPIAFIEYDIAGLLIPEQILSTYLECIKPTADIPR